jgi:hypothetical protein
MDLNTGRIVQVENDEEALAAGLVPLTPLEERVLSVLPESQRKAAFLQMREQRRRNEAKRERRARRKAAKRSRRAQRARGR